MIGALTIPWLFSGISAGQIRKQSITYFGQKRIQLYAYLAGSRSKSFRNPSLHLVPNLEKHCEGTIAHIWCSPIANCNQPAGTAISS